MSELPKVSQQLSDPISENLQKLATLFPAAVKDGELDTEALREELGDFSEIQPGDEKYELNWAGKQASKKEAFQPLLGKTLKYVAEDSKEPETTENIYIEGDNLEALKLLRQNYYGAIKMIYIDPPYNTGQDFVYKDDYKITAQSSDQSEGSRSTTGERLIKNEKSSNRYHANWLNMMYPRLKLAKELLKSNGVIFISIDDNELYNLKELCDELFGKESFIATFIWKRRVSSAMADNNVSADQDYVVCYQKGGLTGFEGVKKDFKRYSNPDNDPRGEWISDNLTVGMNASMRPNQAYDLTDPSTGNVYPFNPNRVWAFIPESMDRMIKEGRIIFPEDTSKRPMQKRFKNELKSTHNPFSTLMLNSVGLNTEATRQIQELMEGNIFEYSKPLSLLETLIPQITNGSDIILDFFSGSAAAAHAIMQINAKDGGNRKHIMVQLPEACDEKSEAAKAGYKTIAEIGKERIRRAGDKIKAELIEKHQALVNEDGELELDDKAPDTNSYILNPDSLDIGFKAFRIEDTQINWLKKDLSGGELVDADISSKDQLDFVPGFTDLDVVYEIMLRQSSIPLTQTINTLTEIGSRTYLYGESYLICLEEDITKTMVEQLAQLEPTPLKFIFRDSAFGKDIAFKDETFRRLNAEIAKHTDGAESYTVEFI